MKATSLSVCSRASVRLGATTLAIFGAFPVLAQSPAVMSLAQVVVTATRFPEPATSLPFGMSVITQSDIARAGVSTVNEAIIKLLGVPGRVDYYGGGDYGLDLRGFGTTASGNQVAIVDGIRLNEADLGGTLVLRADWHPGSEHSLSAGVVWVSG